jgi:hypothetical protein
VTRFRFVLAPVTAGPPKVQPHAVIGPTQACKRLGEREVAMLPIKVIIYIVRHEHADAPHAVALLRPRCEGPARYAPSPSGRRRSGRQDDARERNQRADIPSAGRVGIGKRRPAARPAVPGLFYGHSLA